MSSSAHRIPSFPLERVEEKGAGTNESINVAEAMSEQHHCLIEEARKRRDKRSDKRNATTTKL